MLTFFYYSNNSALYITQGGRQNNSIMLHFNNINVTIHKNSNTDAVAFLIHGLGGRGDQWREQIDTLKKAYTLIVPDLLGHGKSDKPEPGDINPYSFSELYKDIRALFAKYASNYNIVVGHSYGGPLAFSLAYEQPEKIHGLILLTPLPCAPSFAVPFLYRLPLVFMQLFRPYLEYKFIQLAFDPNDSPELIAVEKKAMRTNLLYVIKSMVIGMGDIQLLEASRLNTPVLHIIGENDKLVSPDVQKQFYHSMPQQQSSMIKHAAHLPHLEQPQITNTLINDFLNGPGLLTFRKAKT
jgi:pimeloyl-ACP methyl ester carboxylesterase